MTASRGVLLLARIAEPYAAVTPDAATVQARRARFARALRR